MLLTTRNKKMSKHFHLTVVTPRAVASNNRGDNDGSTQANLQIVSFGNKIYSTVSGDAIRWGLREYLQYHYPSKVNRTYCPEADKYTFKDEKFSRDFIDDDVMGYMDAKAGNKRRGILEVTRAISLDKFEEDVIFSSTGGEKNSNSIHQAQVHYTSYQYSITITPDDLKESSTLGKLLDAIAHIKHVGGNHARFLYSFAPESIAIRVTHDPAPRIMNIFKRDGEGVDASRLLRVVQSGDVTPDELIVGGEIAYSSVGKDLANLGVHVFPGIKEAIKKAKERYEGSC
jgi:CRISPR-associated protein Cst2